MTANKYNRFTGSCALELSSDFSGQLTVSDEDLAKRPVSVLTDSSIEDKKKRYFVKGRGEEEYRTGWLCYKQDVLVLAVRQGNESQVRSVLTRQIKKVVNKDTALWFACLQNNVKIAELLLESGASPEYTFCSVPCVHMSALHGATSLILSFLHKFPNLIDLKMRESVRLEVTPENPLVEFPKGALPVHMCAFGRVTSLILLEVLLPQTELVDIGDSTNMSPLMYAARGGNCFSMRALLQKGAELEHKCDGGKTSLLYAASSGHNSVLELLIKRNACLDARDHDNMGVFSYAKDEEVASKILSTTISCRVESPVELLPIRELTIKGYNQTLKNLLDSMISVPHDHNICVDLGQLEMQPPDWERKESLLKIISRQAPDLALFDSIVLKTYAEYHMKRYGYWYFLIKMLEIIIYIFALSALLMLEVGQPSLTKITQINANATLTDRDRLVITSGTYVLIRLGVLAVIKIIQFGVIFKIKYRQNLQLTATRFRPQNIALKKAASSAVREYLTESTNALDGLILLTALIYAILRAFVCDDNAIALFAIILYFFSICLVFRNAIIIPGLGNYFQTLFFAIKDSFWFIMVFLINLIAFSGMFYIATGIDYTNSYQNTNNNMSCEALENNHQCSRVNFDQEYHWILVTGIRLLIEQGATIKFNFLQVYNWLMAIVFMVFAFITTFVMRTLYIGKITSQYTSINKAAKRYATHRRLKFILHLHTKSIYSLNFVKVYLQKYNKKIVLKKDDVRAKYPLESQNLFSRREQEKLYSKLDELRQEVSEKVEELKRELAEKAVAQDNKLDQLIRLIREMHN